MTAVVYTERHPCLQRLEAEGENAINGYIVSGIKNIWAWNLNNLRTCRKSRIFQTRRVECEIEEER